MGGGGTAAATASGVVLREMVSTESCGLLCVSKVDDIAVFSLARGDRRKTPPGSGEVLSRLLRILLRGYVTLC